jgi:tetratricopeptide (TPR) repeat protein
MPSLLPAVRTAATLAGWSLLSHAAAQTYQPGDQVVVIADANLTVENKSVAKVWPGLTVKVTAVNGNWLWVANTKPGWLDQRHVIPLSRAAIDRLTDMIRVKPDSNSLYSGRAIVWFSLGELDIAIADLNEAIRLNPSAPYYLNRGRVWNAKGEHDRAMADYDEALRLNPQNVSAYNNRGEVWRAKGEYDRAIVEYNEALRLDPSYATVYNNRGIAWNGKGEYDKAIYDFNQAIQLDPKHPLAYSNRGLVWKEKRQYDKAIADFTEALKIDPKYASALNGRGRAWHETGDYDKAVADFNEALRVDPNYVLAYDNRGDAWSRLGEDDKAVADYSEAVRLDPKYSIAYTSRGKIHWFQGAYERAVADFEQGLKLDLKNKYTPIFGHLAAREGGDDDAAGRFLAAAGEYDEWPFPAVQFLRGEIDEPELLKLADDDGKQTEARCYLGVCHAAAGRKEEALAHLSWVKNHGTKSYVEYEIALGLLKRLDAVSGR